MSSTISTATTELLATIVTSDAIVAVNEAVAGNSNYAVAPDVADRTISALLHELTWMRRQRDDALADRAALTITNGEAQHARVVAERKLADAKAAFKKSIALLSED